MCPLSHPWPSVDYFNVLCVTDEPAKGNALGRRALEDWQLLHGKLPPLLNRYLLGGQCSPVACLCSSSCQFMPCFITASVHRLSVLSGAAWFSEFSRH